MLRAEGLRMISRPSLRPYAPKRFEGEALKAAVFAPASGFLRPFIRDSSSVRKKNVLLGGSARKEIARKPRPPLPSSGAILCPINPAGLRLR